MSGLEVGIASVVLIVVLIYLGLYITVSLGLVSFLGVIFMAIILFGAVPDLVEAWQKDFFVGEEGLFTAPEWPIKAVIVLGCSITLLQFLIFGWRYLRPGEETLVEPVSPVE